jgi:transcription antitermination factor NusG
MAKTAKKAPKAKKAVKTPKPTHTVCLSCTGAKSLVKHRIADMHRNENGRLVCAACYAPPPKRKAEPAPADKWYVIQVDPGSEARVRADIMKQVRIRNLEGQVRRVMSPSCLVEKVGPRVGETLAEGTYAVPAAMRLGDAYKAAKEEACVAARAVMAKRNPDADPADFEFMGPTEFPDMRVQAFPGKTPGTLTWKVKEYFESESVRKVVRGRKYPGYMLINMDWNVETERLVRKTRNVWSVLLDPVVTGHNITVTERTSKFKQPGQQLGFNWRVNEPDGGKLVAKGWAATRPEARAAAEKAKADAEAFKPTALDSQEAAEALIAQKAVNQILKDKEELNKAVVNVRPGDLVRVTAGVYRGCRGEVARVVRNPKDKSDVSVVVGLSILGTKLSVTLPHFEVQRTTHGDRD